MLAIICNLHSDFYFPDWICQRIIFCIVDCGVNKKLLVSRIVFAGCCWQCPVSPGSSESLFCSRGWSQLWPADQWEARDLITWPGSANRRPGQGRWPGMQTAGHTLNMVKLRRLATHGHTTKSSLSLLLLSFGGWRALESPDHFHQLMLHVVMKLFIVMMISKSVNSK